MHEYADSIRNLIRNYISDVDTLCKNAKMFDGVFGFNNSRTNDPCHQKFFYAVEEEVKKITDNAEAYEVANLLLKADTEFKCHKIAELMLTALQGHIYILLPLLDESQRKELKEYYDSNIPKGRRVPVQQKVYKALKNG